ncbi:unknown [Prevotella sp. CAG:873]|nr:unknown [Prevotella sp. CAG:873]
MVSEAVIGYEIIFRFCGGYALDDVVEHIVVFKGKEHGLNIGILGANMLHSVFLFVAACQFVFLNNAIEVIIHIGSHNKSILCTAIHGLGI